MSGVSLRRVVKRYGSVVAVDDITFDVPDGKIVAILGPSGCGKTSTLRMIAGLERIDAGEIRIGDKVVNNLEPAQRNVAMAFENYGLYPHWSCYENIAYPLRLRSLPPAEVQVRVLEVAARLRIDDALAMRPGGLSGGVQQRVGLARALVRNPEVFLLDEPMSHVDPDVRGELRHELKRLQREVGATMIYVTHDQLEAMSLADIVVVMNAARIQQIASPSEVFNEPANLFVAGFLGEPPANLFRCEVQAADGDLRLVIDGRHSISIPPRYLQIGQQQHQQLTLAVRPHHISVSHTPRPGWMDATVYVVEPLGDRTVVSIKIGETVAKAEVTPDFTAAIDEPVSVSFDPNHSLLFTGSDGSAM